MLNKNYVYTYIFTYFSIYIFVNIRPYKGCTHFDRSIIKHFESGGVNEFCPFHRTSTINFSTANTVREFEVTRIKAEIDREEWRFVSLRPFNPSLFYVELDSIQDVFRYHKHKFVQNFFLPLPPLAKKKISSKYIDHSKRPVQFNP